MARNLTRSRSGSFSSSASSRTRALKSSQESSRLRKRSPGRAEIRDELVEGTGSSCRTESAREGSTGRAETLRQRRGARARTEAECRPQVGLRVHVTDQPGPGPGKRDRAARTVGPSRPRAESRQEVGAHGGEEGRPGALAVGNEGSGLPAGRAEGCGQLLRPEGRQVGGERGDGRPLGAARPVLQGGGQAARGLVGRRARRGPWAGAGWGPRSGSWATVRAPSSRTTAAAAGSSVTTRTASTTGQATAAATVSARRASTSPRWAVSPSTRPAVSGRSRVFATASRFAGITTDQLRTGPCQHTGQSPPRGRGPGARLLGGRGRSWAASQGRGEAGG